MALYISLEPFAYTDGNEVVHVLEVGRLIEMTTDQAALYPGKIAYWGSGSNYLAPQITMLAYDSTLVFPNVGSKFHVYLDQSTGKLWQWNEVSHEYTLVSVAGSVTPSGIEGVTPTGEALMTAADQAAARDALGFVEAAQDAIAAALGGATGVTVTYNDAANTITISGLGDSSSSAENIRDIIGTTLVGLGLINIAVDDANNTITFSTTATANATDAALRDRSTHTGTQPQSSITNLTTDLASKQPEFLVGTIATAAATAAKTVTLDAVPSAGDWLQLTMTLGNSVSTPTLSVNGGAALPMVSPAGGTNAVGTAIAANSTLLVYFDGANYRWVNGNLAVLNNLSNAEIDLGTAGTARSITGALAAYIRGPLLVANTVNGTETVTIASGSITTVNSLTVGGATLAVGDKFVALGAPAASGAMTVGVTNVPANGLYQVTAVGGSTLSVARAAEMSSTNSPIGKMIRIIGGTGYGPSVNTIVTVTLPVTGAFTYGTTNLQFNDYFLGYGQTLSRITGLLNQKANAIQLTTGQMLNNVIANAHPESNRFAMLAPFLNDQAYNLARGGTLTMTRNGVTEALGAPSACFTPDVATCNIAAVNGSSDVLVLTVGMASPMVYSTVYGIQFSQSFRAQNVQIDIYDSVAAAWINNISTITNDQEGVVMFKSSGGGNGGANPITQVRYTLTNFQSSANNTIRIVSLFTVGYASPLLRAGFLARDGGQMYGPITYAADPVSGNELARKSYVDARSTPLTTISGFDRGSGTRRLISSMAKALAGTGVSEHLIIGDSMSSAYNGTAFDFPLSWHRKVKALLFANGYPDGGTGLISTNEANGGRDPRWAFSGTADISSNVYVALGTASSTATFTSDIAGTIVDVVYSNAGGSFSVKIDGAAAVPVVATGALTIGTYTVTGLTNAPHTVIVTATSGSAIICAAQVRNTTGVRFTSLGKYGLRASGFLGDGGFVKSIAVGAMTSPDVLHIAIGANDMINGATAAATVTNIQTIRNLWPSADVILYVEPITENNEITDAAYAVFATALRALSVTLGCPLIDWNMRYGGAAAIIAMGFVGADGVHPNAVAQADMGGVVYQALRTAAVT